MAKDEALPETVEDALRRGFKRIGELSPTIRQAIEFAKIEMIESRSRLQSPCGPGHIGPCSVINYPNGVTEVCYCNAANQCDDCVFQQP